MKEEEIGQNNPHVESIKKYVNNDDKVIEICGKIESEISLLETEEEKFEFMEAVGIEESGLSTLIKKNLSYARTENFFHGWAKRGACMDFQARYASTRGCRYNSHRLSAWFYQSRSLSL